MSILGRACDLDTGKTYALLRQLREHSVSHLRQLWRLTTDRHQRRDDSGARQATQVEWGETKRRLGSTGRNAKRELMPGWAAVVPLPLYNGMGNYGAAAAVQAQTNPLSDGIAWRPAYDRRVYGKASTNNERS